MRTIAFAFAAPALATPILFLAVQDPPRQDPLPPPEVETWEELRDRKNQETLELLEGSWSLQEFHSVGAVVPPQDVQGFLLIVDGYLSLVVHVREPVPGEADLYLYHSQANVSQFELTLEGGSTMLTATLIGHSDFGGEFAHELPNEPREFMVDVHEHDLFLRRVDGSALQFRRMKPGRVPEAARERLAEERAGGGF